MKLQAQGIKLEGTIALTRYGGTGRGAKVSGSLQCKQPGGVGEGRSSIGWGVEPWARPEQGAGFVLLPLDASPDPTEPEEINASGKVFSFFFF